jgi:hypothetical protein
MAKSSKKLGLPAGTPRRRSSRAKIPRPPNAWILFRSDQIRAYNESVEPGKARLMQSELSSLIAQRWHDADEATTAYYHGLADEAKRKHQEEYPDYIYAPESKADKEARLAREKAEKAAAREAKKEAARAAKRAPLPASAFTNKALGAFAADVARMTTPTTAEQPSAGPSTHASTPAPESYIPAAVMNATVFDATRAYQRSGPQGPSPPLSLATTPEPTTYDYQSPGAGPSNFARHVSPFTPEASSSPVELGLLPQANQSSVSAPKYFLF